MSDDVPELFTALEHHEHQSTQQLKVERKKASPPKQQKQKNFQNHKVVSVMWEESIGYGLYMFHLVSVF